MFSRVTTSICLTCVAALKCQEMQRRAVDAVDAAEGASDVFFSTVARKNRSKPNQRPSTIAFFWQRQTASSARPSNVHEGRAVCFDGRSRWSKRKTFLFHIHVGTLHRASRRRPRPRTDAERERLFPYFHNLIDNDRNGTDGRKGRVGGSGMAAVVNLAR